MLQRALQPGPSQTDPPLPCHSSKLHSALVWLPRTPSEGLRHTRQQCRGGMQKRQATSRFPSNPPLQRSRKGTMSYPRACACVPTFSADMGHLCGCREGLSTGSSWEWETILAGRTKTILSTPRAWPPLWLFCILNGGPCQAGVGARTTIVLYSTVGTHSALLLTGRRFSTLMTTSPRVFHREVKV